MRHLGEHFGVRAQQGDGPLFGCCGILAMVRGKKCKKLGESYSLPLTRCGLGQTVAGGSNYVYADI